MSFILDALKKSENERARQNGPALLEARVVPQRRGMPWWAVVMGVVLFANLGMLAWMLMRTTPPPAPVVAPVAAAAPSNVAAAPVAPAAPTAVPAPAPAPAPAPSTPPPPALTGPYIPPAAIPPAASSVVNPADYAPARAAGPSPRPTPRATANGSTFLDMTLPTASDLSASGSGLPTLRLALHAFDADPANRYVLVNSQRLKEGETTVDGVRVETIAPAGVLMSWRGQRFRLMPGE